MQKKKKKKTDDDEGINKHTQVTLHIYVTPLRFAFDLIQNKGWI